MDNTSRASEILSGMEGEYFIYTEGGVAFLEPVSKEQIKSNLPPRSLVEDNPYTKVGFQFLTELAQAQRLRAWLILSGHNGKQEFDDIIADEFSREALLNSTVVGIEVDWQEKQGKLIAEPVVPEPIADNYPGQLSFRQAQLSWLGERFDSDLILPMEYDCRKDDELATKMIAAFKIYMKAEKDEKLSERERSRIKAISLYSYNAVRVWAMLGQFGYWLSVLEKAGKLPHLINASIMLGSGHEATARRLRDYFGIPTEVDQIIHSAETSEERVRHDKWRALFTKSTTTAHMTFAEIDALPA